MGSRDSRLARMGETAQQWADRRTRNQRISFERKVVRKILKGVGVPAVELKVNEPDIGTPNADMYLTLGWLHDAFPEFPVRLMAHEINDIDVDALFSPWKRTSVWTAWKNVEEVLGGERSKNIGIGCALNAGSWGDVVIHDGGFPHLDQSELRKGLVELQWTYQEHKITVESLGTFICKLRSVWRPRE